jgi:hypothetical protein
MLRVSMLRVSMLRVSKVHSLRKLRRRRAETQARDGQTHSIPIHSRSFKRVF